MNQHNLLLAICQAQEYALQQDQDLEEYLLNKVLQLVQGKIAMLALPTRHATWQIASTVGAEEGNHSFILPEELLLHVAKTRTPSIADNIMLAVPLVRKQDCIGILVVTSDNCVSMEMAQFLHPFACCMSGILVSRAIVQAKQDAEEALKQQNRLVANLSHDLRTPLSCIIGVQNLLQQSPMNEEQQDLVGMIGSSASMLLTMVNDILDYSKLEASALVFDSKEFDLRIQVENVMEMCALKWKDKGLDIVNNFAHDLPCKVKGDANRLSQILVNLLNNACKATDHGHVVLKTQYACNSSHNHVPCATIKFSVKDSGKGIPEHVVSKLGTPFFQIEPASQGGTGLGLAIVKQLIAGFDGTELVISSVLNHGSEFSFSIDLPISAANCNKEVPSNLEANTLIVSKKPCSLSILGELLSICGIRSQSSESLQGAKLHKYNLVIVDHDLHENMHNVVTQWKLRAPKTRFLVVAPIGTPVHESLDCIIKPFKLAQVVSKIHALPLGITCSTSASPTPCSPIVESPIAENFHVLVVDDNPINAVTLIRSILGKEAMQIVALSAKVASPTELDEFIQMGFDSYMTKPIKLEQLEQIVQTSCK